MKDVIINGKLIKKSYERHSDRTKVSMYVSKKIYNNFKKACGKAPISHIIEDLMEAFTNSSK
ncbi:MAG: hypothetical protein H6625_14170 [Bdellovibrionaceae bacterium]|nr:hypothetical protein [Pseudobdellovibrionaceae bacterium]